MKKPSKILEQLDAAKALHKAGHIADAENIYREILSVDKDNAEVIGLFASAVQYRGDLDLAKKLWERALEAKSPTWIFLHNLQNHLQLLMAQGAEGEVKKLVRQPLPDWPDLRIPDQSERGMLIALANALVTHGKVDSAARLLKSVVSSVPNDAGLLHVLGKAQLLKGDIATARKTLTAADAALQSEAGFLLLADLHHCAMAEGDYQAARALKSRVVAEHPVFISPRQPGQKANILVLNSMQFGDIKSFHQLHFSLNYPSQIAHILADEFNFSSIFAEYPAGRAASEKMPKPDLIINNLASGERLLSDGTLSAVSEFADSFGVSVINHPSKVVLTTRDRSAEIIASIPGIVVPQICRYSKDGKTVTDLVKEIESQFDYPMIRRTLFFQGGKGMSKIENRGDLVKILSAGIPEDFFMTAFVDSRGPTGYYRKIRAAIVGDEITIVRVDYDAFWMVHGRKTSGRVAFYRNNPHLLAEGDRICADPDRALGHPIMQSLRQIRDSIPLEIFGVDFDVAPDGRLVFYEANATMNLLSTARKEVNYPRHAQERLVSAFRLYLSSLLVAKEAPTAHNE